MTKVIAGMDEETTELLMELYSKITPRVFRAKDIKTAEAAKVIENVQRDLNIALMNELSLIFAKLGLSTKDVLEAAATKWNFHKFYPGLVGGHCIPVDPYYLVHISKELGYHPQVILSGRAINDYMPRHVAEMTIKGLNNVGKVVKGSKVLIMGLTYKQNVADIRETPAKEIVKNLKEYGVQIFGYDPLLADIEGKFGIESVPNLKAIPKMDAVILAVAHKDFENMAIDELSAMMGARPVLIDVRGSLDQGEAERAGFYYYTL